MLRSHGRAIRFPYRLLSPFPNATSLSSFSSVVTAEEEQEPGFPVFWNPDSLKECTEPHGLHGNRICRDGRWDYWISQLRYSHALAREGRSKDARTVLMHMLEKEGDGKKFSSQECDEPTHTHHHNVSEQLLV